jgi:hypothetical protein
MMRLVFSRDVMTTLTLSGRSEMSMHQHRSRNWRHRIRLVLMVACVVLAWPLVAQTVPDLCGCRDHPNSLGAFDLRDRATWPPGTTVSNRFVTIPLPADGVLVFDSMYLDWSAAAVPGCCPVELGFTDNAANTPVTILVKGNVTIQPNAMIQVRGSTGGTGSPDMFGAGGRGGNGGFRGGDGAYRLANNSADGGIGLGPGGGAPATAVPSVGAGGGTFVGGPELLPLIGGAGGGGGRSANLTTSCSGGGGGGGGGALLLAANGTVTVNNTGGGIIADGGAGGGASGFSCATGGGGGGGGAIRIIANTLNGSGRLYARAGRRWEDSVAAGSGTIRLEALTNTFNVTMTDPVASRTSSPGPIVNPFTPRVAVTAVAGQPVGETPQGVYGAVDIQVPVPGPTAIDLATDGVPVGTTVNVTVKPRVGTLAITQSVTLSNCDGAGRCLANVTVDLGAGVYAVEARATFQLPAP